MATPSLMCDFESPETEDVWERQNRQEDQEDCLREERSVQALRQELESPPPGMTEEQFRQLQIDEMNHGIKLPPYREPGPTMRADNRSQEERDQDVREAQEHDRLMKRWAEEHCAPYESDVACELKRHIPH